DGKDEKGQRKRPFETMKPIPKGSELQRFSFVIEMPPNEKRGGGNEQNYKISSGVELSNGGQTPSHHVEARANPYQEGQ
ncbi:MAG: hypothetical protein ACREFR_05720, partial [Limisphaerales bacterium]